MPNSKNNSRTRLLRAAVKVSYRHGFGHTSLADIAKEARVPLGNVYYYFKSKEEIGKAIIESRMSHFQEQLRELNEIDSPRERLCGFIQIKVDNREDLARSGCPVGTLCSELHKHRGVVAEDSRVLFTEGLAWMEAQFRALGKGRGSRALAVHLMAALQGVSVLAHTFNDTVMVEVEAKLLKAWVRAL